MKRNNPKADPTVIHKTKVCGWNTDPTWSSENELWHRHAKHRCVGVSYTDYSTSSCRQGSFLSPLLSKWYYLYNDGHGKFQILHHIKYMSAVLVFGITNTNKPVLF